MKTIKLKCHNCKKEFEQELKHHVRRKKIGQRNFYCSYKCCGKKVGGLNRCKQTEKTCSYCKKKFLSSVGVKGKKCCSIKCARTFASTFTLHTAESRERMSKTMIQKWKNDSSYANKCLTNLKNVGKRRFTSKGEEEIRNYIMRNHKNDEWTFGGHIHHNGVRLVRDLYSDKIKVCVEYDGVWHFKDIHGQLAEKQIKDKMLLDWCKVNGYRLIRIDESVFKTNKKQYMHKIEDWIYNTDESKKLIGNRYSYIL